MLGPKVVNISITRPYSFIPGRIFHSGVGEYGNDGPKKFGIREEEECSQNRDRVVTHHPCNSDAISCRDNDESSYTPDVQWEQKLEPCLPIHVESVHEAGLYAKIQVKP